MKIIYYQDQQATTTFAAPAYSVNLLRILQCILTSSCIYLRDVNMRGRSEVTVDVPPWIGYSTKQRW